jgi:hypothetical protein
MNKKYVLMLSLFLGMLFIQGFVRADHDKDEKAVNLKILPKNISDEELHKIMREYARSLGVKCGFCHAQGSVGADGKPRLDFASDEKEEKQIARKMMRMVEGINRKYIDKMDAHDQLEHVSCVTCHMGQVKPVISTDSLRKS